MSDNKLSVISRAQARRMLNDPTYRREMLGNPSNSPDHHAWQTDWLERIAGGWTPCSCRTRHRGACSSQPPPHDMNDTWRPDERLF